MAQTLIHEMKEIVLGWTEGFHASVRQVGIKVDWPAEVDSDRTASANTVTTEATEQPGGLVSLLGKYNDDPSWEDFPAFLEQYRREIDEMNR